MVDFSLLKPTMLADVVGIILIVVVVIVCVGHDTDLVGSNPIAGIYRQAKRTTSRCQ